MNIEQQLENLEQKILRIEKHLNLTESPVAEIIPEKKSEIKPEQKPAIAGVVSSTENASGKLLGVVGTICFIFAAVYLIRLALDSGWLTPVRQVSLAGVLGLGLIALGFVFKEKDHEYFSYLPAAGVVVLYCLTSFVGYDLTGRVLKNYGAHRSTQKDF